MKHDTKPWCVLQKSKKEWTGETQKHAGKEERAKRSKARQKKKKNAKEKMITGCE